MRCGLLIIQYVYRGNLIKAKMNKIVRIIGISLATLIATAIILFQYFKLPPSEPATNFHNLQIVHKGGSPENTLKAIEASHQQGVKAVELDVRISKDHHLIVFHDEILDRMTNGFGDVKDFTLAELTLLKVDKTETIPTLEEAIQLLIKLDMRAELDIRNNPDHAIIAERIDALFRKYPIYNRIFVSSFNPKITYAIRARNPKIIVGYGFIQVLTGNPIVDFIMRSPLLPKLLGAGIVEPHWKMLNEKMVQYWTKRGILINPWTVNTKEQKDLIKKYGITTYVTNCFDAYCEPDLYDIDKFYGLSATP